MAGWEAFDAEVDQLIRELEPFGVWKGQIVAFLMLCLQAELDLLRGTGKNQQAETLLRNFAHTLRFELQQLRSA